MRRAGGGDVPGAGHPQAEQPQRGGGRRRVSHMQAWGWGAALAAQHERGAAGALNRASCRRRCGEGSGSITRLRASRGASVWVDLGSLRVSMEPARLEKLRMGLRRLGAAHAPGYRPWALMTGNGSTRFRASRQPGPLPDSCRAHPHACHTVGSSPYPLHRMLPPAAHVADERSALVPQVRLCLVAAHLPRRGAACTATGLSARRHSPCQRPHTLPRARTPTLTPPHAPPSQPHTSPRPAEKRTRAKLRLPAQAAPTAPAATAPAIAADPATQAPIAGPAARG